MMTSLTHRSIRFGTISFNSNVIEGLRKACSAQRKDFDTVVPDKTTQVMLITPLERHNLHIQLKDIGSDTLTQVVLVKGDPSNGSSQAREVAVSEPVYFQNLVTGQLNAVIRDLVTQYVEKLNATTGKLTTFVQRSRRVE